VGVVASAPAKIILFGEHFVVYGEPAIVTAIDKRAQVTAEKRTDKRIYINSPNLKASGYFSPKKQFKAEQGNQEARQKLEPIKIAVEKILNLSKQQKGVNINVQSNIPVAAGLGSSAAVAAATATAVSKLLGIEISKEDVFRTAYEAERFVHGTPSGIDPTISTYGGVLLFHKDRGPTPLNVKEDISLVVGNTGIERSTGEMVSGVRQRRERYPSIINPIIKAGGMVALRAAKALEAGDLNTLGELMNINHAMLSAIGVSNEFLDRLVYAARKAEALGAKLTGAGGGGCMVALSPSDKLKQVVNAIEREGGTAFVARKTNEGVKIEG